MTRNNHDTPPSGKGALKILRLFCSDDASWRKANLDHYNFRKQNLPQQEFPTSPAPYEKQLIKVSMGSKRQWTKENQVRTTKHILENPDSSDSLKEAARAKLHELEKEVNPRE